MKNVLFFDLDGTLTDSGLGIMNSVKYSLNKFGIKEEDEKTLKSFIGPPFTEMVKEYYGFTQEEAIKAIGYYREYFTDKGIFENSLYQGVKEVLKNLKNAGKSIYLATSKPTVFAEKILKYFDIYKYFDGVYGAMLDGSLMHKDDIIKFALDSEKVDVNNAVMIGDRRYDVEGGKKFNLTTVGVLYGYGDKEELQKAGADYIVDSAEQLEKILMEI